ncbi:excinuclease ABC subunit UvrA [Myxococcota bacterium]|nr:excinuclease ABC subunit UvrA [Myxococcota bacterium]MBU1383194.1 excinuclease ABC subunit UvrA [Myxococcota bacterium]MBU1496428.1 excinuclease ABC subunit UvrA [Myxococcota bacterium]
MTIINAVHHNLKNISTVIPREELTVVCGPSGSGKSTLAFDIIYAEGQRRYVESLSAYARQFLPQLDKPKVEKIEGLSPAISIEQHSMSRNPRSTVATVTEIYDFLRVFWARIGTPHCPVCGKPVSALTQKQIQDEILRQFEGQSIIILAPIIRNQKGLHKDVLSDLMVRGYSRVRVDGLIQRTEEVHPLAKTYKHNIEAVIDRLTAQETNRSRLAQSIEQAVAAGSGTLFVLEGEENIYSFSVHGGCQEHNFNIDRITPALFSFNTPTGFCPDCWGLGSVMYYDPDLIAPNRKKSINSGAIEFPDPAVKNALMPKIKEVGARYGFNADTPLENISVDGFNAIFHGDSAIDWHGIIAMFKSGESFGKFYYEKLSKYRRTMKCRTCEGARLNPRALSVLIDGKNIHDFTTLSIADALSWLETTEFHGVDLMIAEPLIIELTHRISFLSRVGLDYITLCREMSTLSGGEAQRIRLASQLGTGLTGVTYVLDEPSIGLHQKDNRRLLETLMELRNRGNTVIVVEHDEQTILNADHVLELGPGSGNLGGEIVFEGTVKNLLKSTSLTGRYLRGELQISVPEKRREPCGFISIRGASTNNLKKIDVDFPKGCLVCVTGVSGSGKSSLVVDTLYGNLALSRGIIPDSYGQVDSITGLEGVERTVIIDQTPIGRTPRSNPATYTKIFDDIRDIFAQIPESRVRGFTKSRFSFNVKGGRCDKCEGDGEIRVEMMFLPDVYITCEECSGERYNRETLEIRYKGKSISDVLKMTVRQASEFFDALPSLKRKLGMLMDVGLEYIQLGQSATTLSGGEAQRIKISRELGKTRLPGTVYILDEPTTGLHMHEVGKLIEVLNRLVDKGATVITIEHNLDVIKASDFIVDLGPGGGINGGMIIAKGSPEEISRNPSSITGEFLNL